MIEIVAAEVKVVNRRAVFDYMRTKFLQTGEETSKAEISRERGISAPTLMKIMDFFLKENLVTLGDEVVVSLGRPSQMLKVNENSMFAAGFLLEGRYLYMGVVNVLNNIVYQKMIEVIPDFWPVMEMIQESLVVQLLEEAKIPIEQLIGIGIAVSASYNKERQMISRGPMVQVNTEVYVGEFLQKMEEKYQMPVFFENDANAECLGINQMKHHFDAKGDILLLSIGTGIGAGIMLEGKLRRGYHEMSGEIGVAVLDDKNTLEYLLGLDQMIKKFDPGDRKEIAEEVAFYLAKLIFNANSLLDCEEVVLCGYTATMLGTGLLDAIQNRLKKLASFENEIKLRLESPFCGVLGIASECIEYQIQKILEQ